MKKAGLYLIIGAVVVFAIDWGVMGIKLFANGDYEIMAEAVIGCICFAAILVGGVLRTLGNKCPHCGRILPMTGGKFCPYCGKEI